MNSKLLRNDDYDIYRDVLLTPGKLFFFTFIE